MDDGQERIAEPEEQSGARALRGVRDVDRGVDDRSPRSAIRSAMCQLVKVAAVTAGLFLMFSSPALADADGSSLDILGEACGAYVGTGSPAEPYGNLYTCYALIQGLNGIVNDPDSNWNYRFYYENASAWELDWKSSVIGGNDYRLADDVDLAAWCGHGLGNVFCFTTCRNDWYTTHNDLGLGDRDCEWLLAFTCNFLNASRQQVGPAMNGLHSICGFDSGMLVTSNGGSRFAYWATVQSKSVWMAWKKYTWDTQPRDQYHVACMVAAQSCYTDKLWGEGGPVGPDPPAWSPATDYLYAKYSWPKVSQP